MKRLARPGLAQPTQRATGPNSENMSRVLLLAFVVLVFGAIAWQAMLAFPSADDFCFGEDAVNKGIVGAARDLYVNWTGRYTSNFLIGWFAASRSVLTTAYFIFPAVIIAANILAAGHAIRRIGVDSKLFAFAMAILLICSYSLRETVFWLSGGITYGLACALFIALIGEEYSLFARNLPNPRLRTLACSLSAILLAGFNETIMVAHVALLSLLFVASLAAKRDAAALGTILAAAVIGACIVVLAPGNSAREAAESFVRPTLPAALANSLAWLIFHYADLGLTVILAVYSTLVVMAPGIGTGASLRRSWQFAAFLGVAAWAGIFTRYYVIGDPGPARTLTVDAAIVFIMCLIAAVNLYRGTGRIVHNLLHVAPQSRLFFVGVVAVAVFGQPVPDTGSLRSSLAATRYAYPLKKYMDSRFEKLVEAHDRSPVLPDYPDKKRALTFFADIEPDPAHWRNKCFSGYFGLDDVRLEKASLLPQRH